MSVHLSKLKLMTALEEWVQKIIVWEACDGLGSNRDKQKRLYRGVHLRAME